MSAEQPFTRAGSKTHSVGRRKSPPRTVSVSTRRPPGRTPRPHPARHLGPGRQGQRRRHARTAGLTTALSCSALSPHSQADAKYRRYIDASKRLESHPRMPLALTPDHYDSWLDPHHQDPDELRALLTQPADGHLDARPVSTAVNNVRNNGPQLLDAITP
ncbi:SOS response associated peptidase (SRAP) [Streptomyces sp. OV198]|nr:SOS response associated peptidase (SRAP) [Streptomyces sp. Ag82_O1-15]SOE47715.1 SOS response associated peptidase (SRAP) [Streptomyces sp. OV198]